MQKLLLFVVSLCCTLILNAQSAANYSFTRSANASLVDMSSGTTQLYGADVDTYTGTVTNIGFDFVFMGTIYSQFSCNPDGAIRFGSTVITGHAITAAANVPYLVTNGIDGKTAPTTGKVHFKVIGSAPNRSLVIEWSNVYLYYSTTNTTTSTYQARIYEANGVIEYTYGSMFLGGTSSRSMLVGFSSSNTANTVGSLGVVNTGSPTYNSTSTAYATTSITSGATIPNINSTADGARTSFVFTPPTVTAPTAAVTPVTNIAATAMTVNWQDSPNEIGYDIQRSTDNINFTTVASVAANVTSQTITGLASTTTYHWRIVAKSEGSKAILEGGGYSGVTTTAPTMTGTYNIPGDYATITAALSAVAANALAGPVVLNLTTGYTSASETYPITFGNYGGSSSTNTLTLRPGVTGLAISGNVSATDFIRFDGARNIIIDGRVDGTGAANLVIQNEAASRSAVLFINEASNNTLRYVNIRGITSSATSGVVHFSTTTGTNGNDNNLLDYCNISNALDGVGGSLGRPTNGVFSSGTTTTAAQNNSSNSITNSNIFNFYVATASTVSVGILISTGNTDWTITNNHIYQPLDMSYTNGSTGTIGISVANTSGGNFTVTNNFVGGKQPNAGGTAWTQSGTGTNTFIGIRMSVAVTPSSTVDINTIANVSVATATTSSINAGISVTSGSVAVGTSNSGGGNTIGSLSVASSVSFNFGSTTGAVGNFAGIIYSSSALNQVINNKIGGISILGGTAGTGTLRGIWYSGSGSGTALISNNTIGGLPGNSISTSVNGDVYGIHAAASSNTTYSITGNVVQNIRQTSTLTSGELWGIYNQGLIATINNNIVRGLLTTTTSSTIQLIGIAHSNTSATSLTISGNTIYSLLQANIETGTTHHAFGIYVNSAGTENTITRNLIHSLAVSTTGSAISCQIRGIDILAGGGLVANNVIRVGLSANGNSVTGNYFVQGINKQGAQLARFYYNTVVVSGANVGAGTQATAAFRRSNTSSIDSVRNNIFVNNRSNASSGGGTGRHYSVSTANFSNWFAANNLYHGTGTGYAVGTVDGGTTPRTTMTDWQVNSYSDASSGFASPGFVSEGGDTATVNLAVSGTTPAESAGIGVPNVLEDFAGAVRSGTGFTDVGAYEATNTANDVTPPLIQIPNVPLTIPGLIGTSFTATIVDASGVPTSGGLVPKLHYRRNIPASSFSIASGTLVSGTATNGVWSFVLDYSTLSPAVTTGTNMQFFVAAQDNAAVANIGTNPAMGAGMTDVNNITTIPLSLQQYTTAEGIGWAGTADNNWNNTANWLGGVLPTSSDVIAIGSGGTFLPQIATGVVAACSTLTINAGASVSLAGGTLNVATASSGGITINTGGTLAVNSGTLNVGAQDNVNNNRTIQLAGGNLTVTGGTVNVEGSINMSSGSPVFTQSGGTIRVDGNGTTASATLSPVNIANGTVAWSGGDLIIVDPMATAIPVITYSAATGFYSATGTHTVSFGDGTSTTSGNAKGFYVNLTNNSGISRLQFRNLTINGASGTNRFTSSSANAENLVANGNFTINTNSEHRQGTFSLYLGGNLENNGKLISDATSVDYLAFEDVSSGTAAAVTIPQTVSGTGVFENSTTTVTGNIHQLKVNNSSSAGVTFSSASPFTITNNLRVVTGRLTIQNLKLFQSGTSTTLIELQNAASQVNTVNLEVLPASGATVTLSGSGLINVSGTYTHTSGTLTGNNRLTLKSTSSGSANLVYTAGTISAAINVERYIQGKRAYRFLGQPFTAAIPLSQLMAGTGASNTGIDVTGAGGSLNGFTTTLTNAASAFTYNPLIGNATGGVDPGWTAIGSATASSWLNRQGIRIFVRGTKGQGLDGATYSPAPTTVTMSGVPNTGSVVTTLTRNSSGNSDYNLIANPYAATIDMQSAGITRGSEVGANFSVWNPDISNASNRGVYVTEPFATANTYRYLPSGAAFFVTTANGSANNTITFTEAVKSSNAASNGLFRGASGYGANSLNLELSDSSGYADRILFFFNKTNTSDNFDAVDGEKLINPDANLYSSSADGRKLSIDARQLPASGGVDMVIPITIQSPTNRSFTLKAVDFNLSDVRELYLKDKLTNQLITLNHHVEYTFHVVGERFEIIMRGNATLPVDFVSVKAQQKGQSTIAVQWQVATDANISHFEVEESVNGSQFSMLTRVMAVGVNNYEAQDAQVNNGTNFYRIKAVARSGATKISSTVLVKLGATEGTVTVMPNKIGKGALANIQLQNLQQGEYNLQLFNTAGQLVQAKILQYTGGFVSTQLETAALTAGVYKILISNKNGYSITEQLVIQ
jgi:hypothetical protein